MGPIATTICPPMYTGSKYVPMLSGRLRALHVRVSTKQVTGRFPYSIYSDSKITTY